ncbi:murein hydrolase activator EnvC family protein [Cryptosporangium minutisporangium]|uniref:M23 family metallopeptidase n=1 Tax=Cryptosporangium minutisporangium TaxID=113569 RepID=A0ABP6T0J2_9ACTN
MLKTADAGRVLRRVLIGMALVAAGAAGAPVGAGATPSEGPPTAPVEVGAEPTAVAAEPAGADPTAVGAQSAEWRWPLDGVPRVVRRFDPPADPYGPGHRGVDLAGAPAATVRAAGAGVVRFAGPVGGRGVVSVTHPSGARTTYEPVRAVVRTGDRVSAGTALGRLDPGHLGCAEAACLHWGLIVEGSYRDPLALVGPGRVRLYPGGTS